MQKLYHARNSASEARRFSYVTPIRLAGRSRPVPRSNPCPRRAWNGIAEKGNDLVEQALRQALLLRGSPDFASLESYKSFLGETVAQRINRSLQDALRHERQALRPLPASKLPSYTSYQLKVRSTSVIRLSNRSYSVPSNLIGHRVRVHQYPDELRVFYGERLVERMPRLRGDKDRRIDYRHVIWSLVRKPYAFARYRYREELFPSLRFRAAWDALSSWRGSGSGPD